MLLTYYDGESRLHSVYRSQTRLCFIYRWLVVKYFYDIAGSANLKTFSKLFLNCISSISMQIENLQNDEYSQTSSFNNYILRIGSEHLTTKFNWSLILQIILELLFVISFRCLNEWMWKIYCKRYSTVPLIVCHCGRHKLV